MQNEDQKEEVTTEAEAEVDQPEVEEEIEVLRRRANQMGIKFHPMTGIVKLRAKINAKLTANTQGLTSEQIVTETSNVSSKNPLPPGLAKLYKGGPISQKQFQQERGNQTRRDINRLVRIQVTCMNPNKSEWEGEIISVGSAKLGTFKKYVPFNSIEGWHVPHIIYEAMKERKFTQFFNAKGPRGEKIRKGKLMPEFSIQVLDPLSKEELQELAQRQTIVKSA